MNDKLILVVEDDEDLRYLAKQQFKKIGLNAETATDGQDALNKLKEKKYDLILMDVMMPVLNGVNATIQIRESEKNSNNHITIIAMTAVSDKERCISAGMDDYIFKPIMLDTLKALVSKWL
ncbi:MAG: response regulator [Candidatus Melainabacteria bacterium]|nr:MAG: response regulator [Candidatus Melainabacteria bacterium]